MSKAEKYIQQRTHHGINANNHINGLVLSYNGWILPHDAREATKIAKEEVIEETCKWLKENICTAKTYTDKAGMQFTVKVDEIIECYCRDMKGE